jgi:hypothetical protein
VLSPQVIEPVIHPDMPAQIDEREAAEIVALQQFGFIERNLACGGVADCEPQLEELADSLTATGNERVILGKLNRLPKALSEELSSGASLRACRDALEAAGHPFKLLCGTPVFVHPSQYRAVVSALSVYDLRPYHVVFSEAFEHLLEEAMGHHKGAWFSTSTPVEEKATSGSEICSASDASSTAEACERMSEDLGADGDWIICVQRTFVALVPPRAQLEGYITASAPGARPSGFANPRAVASKCEDFWA